MVCLTGVVDKMLASKVWRPWLGTLEQVGVVAAFAELHDDVEEAGPVCPSIHSLNVLLEKSRIVLLLHLAHADLQDGLLLGRQPLFHVTLQSPQEKRPQNLHYQLRIGIRG